MRDNYLSAMKPIMDQLNSLSPSMDSCMSAMGMAGGNKWMQQTCSSMASELTHYMSVACASPDLPTNQATAAQHTATMTGYAQYLVDQSTSVMNSTSSMMSSGVCKL